MRCFILLVFLAFPSAAIAADSASAQPDAISSLTKEVQQLRSDNEKLSARITALETRFPAGQKAIMVIERFGQPPIAPPSHSDPNMKP
jgi:hypothetical protein